MKLNALQLNTLLHRLIKEEKQKIIKENGERGIGFIDDLSEVEPEAYEAIPDAYKADSQALEFYYDNNNNLIAVDEQEKEYIWNPKDSTWSGIGSAKNESKLTVGLVKKIIKEEVVRYSLKQRLYESARKYMQLNEIVSWRDLEKELKSAYDNFKAENPDIKIGNFDFQKVTDSFINDPEARKMMINGDADGLVNKAFDVLGIENPVSDVDVEKHAEDVFGGLEMDVEKDMKKAM